MVSERQEVTTEPEGIPRLSVKNTSKAFGRQVVLRDAELVIHPGELHGLVGQNGSGKSTLVKILTGIHAAESGAEIEVDGVPLGNHVTVPEMRAAGLGVVHQTLGLIEEATVLENVRVGRFRAGRWTRRIDWASERAEVAAGLQRLGCDLDPAARVADLSAEDRASVAIVRALQDHEPGRGMIIFDESTRALTAESLARFYEQVANVRREGAAVLLVSHRLEEVLHVCDHVTVLRDGVVTGRRLPTAELSERDLVKLMIGRELKQLKRNLGRAPTADGGGLQSGGAQVKGLTGTVARNVSFAVAAGEVVGLTGLVGSGFEELPYLLAGTSRAQGGSLTLDDTELQLGRGAPAVSAFIDAGIALVPEGRETEGLALDLTVLENLTLPRMKKRGRRFWSGTAWQEEEVQEAIERLGIRPPRGDVPVGTLSGGNQQKVLLGKWLANRPRLLLLHEPTQGVDVGAHADIAEVIDKTAAEGCAVVVASTDAQGLATVCDRVLVFRDGQIRAELSREFDEDTIVEATFVGAREMLAGYGNPTKTSSP